MWIWNFWKFEITFSQLSGLNDRFLRNTREIFTKDIPLSEKSILQNGKYQQRHDFWNAYLEVKSGLTPLCKNISEKSAA